MAERHLHLIGARRTDRRAHAAAFADVLTVGCHRGLRGPYTGVDTVLRALLPRAVRDWPDLVEAHRVELLYGIPELCDLIGPAPVTLASAGPFQQRTRYFGAGMIRCMNQGLVTFLLTHAHRLAEAGAPPPVLHFDDVCAADPTTQELVALLVRRANPARLRVVVSSRDTALPAEMADALAAFAERRTVPPGPQRAERDAAELVRAYVAADGTSDDPDEEAAYLAADQDEVRALHDARAEELAPGADWGTRVGALAHHRERGSDPRGLGRRALREAFQFCVEAGFSWAVVDLGARGRAVSDPVEHPKDYLRFTQHAASALVPLGRLDEAQSYYQDLRRHLTDPKAHMIACYSTAMLHTRFFSPRDHEAAVAWQNTARVLASLLPDPDERRTHEVFQANGLALIEMHRGEFDRALALVQGGIDRLDRELDEGDWALHRSQLLYNRARLFAVLGRVDEAHADFSALVDLDPYYTDYLNERAKIARRRGDWDAAIADYDRAVALAPPFPELHYNRGTARAEVGDVEGALDDLGYVLEMEPGDVDARLTRAELRLGGGDTEGAALDVRAGLALAPDEPRLHCMAGVVEVERDQLSAAGKHFDAALAADPDYPAALVDRAVVNYRLGMLPEAIADLDRALRLVGPDPDLLLNRGLAHLEAGDAHTALSDFDAALTLPDADITEIRYRRGRCLLELDRREQGEADLRECLRLGAHPEEIRTMLAGAARG